MAVSELQQVVLDRPPLSEPSVSVEALPELRRDNRGVALDTAPRPAPWRCGACGLVNWFAGDEPPSRCYAHPNEDGLGETTFELLSTSEVAAHRRAGGLGIFTMQKAVGPILCPSCRKRTTRKKLETSGMCGSCETAKKRAEKAAK